MKSIKFAVEFIVRAILVLFVVGILLTLVGSVFLGLLAFVASIVAIVMPIGVVIVALLLILWVIHKLFG